MNIHFSKEDKDYLRGVKDAVKSQILQVSGFKEGSFPFRYLGIPLASTNLKSDMYQQLFDKVRKHITTWAAHNISYAGRIQLINSMLFGLENFWCAAVILPKGVVKRLHKLCKDFLWGIEDGGRRHTFMSWRAICQPKEEGGFGIKELLSWNKVLLSRYLYALHEGHSSIWLSWLQSYKIRDATLWTVTSSCTDAEGWADILHVRDSLLQLAGPSAAQLLSSWGGKASKAYDFFRGTSSCVSWASAIWNTSNIPPHTFVGAMAVLRKLPTVDLLCSRGMHLVNRCTLCYHALEDHAHLFFNCPVSMAIVQQILVWMGMTRRVRSLLYELKFGRHLKRSGHWRAKWFSCSMVAATYHIWMERNRRIFQDTSMSIESIVRSIKIDVSIRMLNSQPVGNNMDIVNALNS